MAILGNTKILGDLKLPKLSNLSVTTSSTDDSNASPTFVATFKNNDDTMGLAYSTTAQVVNSGMPARLKPYQNTNTDANSATESGFYYVNSTANRPPFSQSSGTDYRILATGYGTAWCQQIATDFRCNDMFIRRNQADTTGGVTAGWQPWTAVVRMKEGVTGAELKPANDTIAVFSDDANATIKSSGKTLASLTTDLAGKYSPSNLPNQMQVEHGNEANIFYNNNSPYGKYAWFNYRGSGTQAETIKIGNGDSKGGYGNLQAADYLFSDGSSIKTALNSKYVKPSGGIPASDLAGSIPTSKITGLATVATSGKYSDLYGSLFENYAFYDWTGHVKIPRGGGNSGGLLIQWGIKTISGNATEAVTFSYTYGNIPAVTFIQGAGSENGEWVGAIKYTSIAKTGFVVQSYQSEQLSIDWIAVGYYA